ncbi:exopolysaccharide biosynthesis polyprenyl glycosylphosphotransferase [Echinicola pacifica]|uniref:exopolysaccharide biosynthesis polyprenyl glycosylphosphotransferase n=1 Tax=Echinicola pacifica TaxID=346377 RepID=UPI0003680586|nr:exopolysaccharide biosynthesis polyprenyl glycosylphosphotransferase [Echinicola pacifica]
MNNSSKIVAGFFFIWDTVTLGLTFLVSLYLFKGNGVQTLDWALFLGLVSMWFIIVKWRKLYFFNLNEDLSGRIVNYLKSSAILVVILGLTYLVFTFPPTFRKVVLSFSIGFPLVGIVTNFVILSIINRLKNHGGTGKNVLVTGQGDSAQRVNSYFQQHPNKGYMVKGMVKYQTSLEPQLAVQDGAYVSDLDNMGEYLRENQVDEVVVALPFEYPEEIKKILSTADYYGTRVRFVPDYQNLLGENCKVVKQGDMDMVAVRQLPLDDRINLFAKEVFDWCFSSLVLLMLSPLFFVIVLLIKIDSPGPAFYCPVRIGKGGKPFRVFKFRTMRENDTTGKASTQANDPRITKVGKFLRKYSIDELPQFANVFMGDMSVVGPRPHRSFLNEEFQKSVDKAMVRHYVKPGVTGWAQVSGWRGPTETAEQKEQRIAHDLWYLKHWTMKLDMKIIYLTVFGKKTHGAAF